MNGRLGDRIEFGIGQENAIDRWWASHGKSLKETIERYKIWLSDELRRTQIQMARVTEERDILIKQVVALRQTLGQIKEALHDR